MERNTITAFAFLMTTALNAQNTDDYYAGLIINEAEYENIPVKAELLTRDFAALPNSYSLQKYAPTPKNQGKYGTCTSWATSYAARTICEAIANGWTDKNTIDSHTFSPPFVYTLIKDKGDDECSKGSCISDALMLMKSKGVPSYTDFSPWCTDYIPTNIYSKAIDNKIDNYSRIFSSDASTETKIRTTKKAISQNHPVVFGMECYASLSNAGDYWDGKADRMRGYHAMCVVAYDDNKYDGSFLIMNSWGTSWGNGGFTWVKYADFAKYTDYAFDMYVAPKAKPAPTPKPTPVVVNVADKPSISWVGETTASSSKFLVKASVKSKTKITSVSVYVNGSASRGIVPVTNDGNDMVINQEVNLKEGRNIIKIDITNASGTTSIDQEVNCAIANNNQMAGSFYLQLSTGEQMPVTLDATSQIPSYKASGSYISGTRYRIYISNNEPAYVYVIGSDLNNSVSKVFPPTDKISAALVYKSNNIALPDEQWYIEMDNTVGTDYVCVLYSSEELPINQIVSDISNTSGTFYQKLQTVLGSKLAPRSNITLQNTNASFSAKTDKTIVPIVLEVTHK